MTTWRPIEYLMRCNVCGLTVQLANMPKGWTMEAGLNPDGTVDFVNAKHYCPEHKDHAHETLPPGAGQEPK